LAKITYYLLFTIEISKSVVDYSNSRVAATSSFEVFSATAHNTGSMFSALIGLLVCYRPSVRHTGGSC